MLKVQEQKEGFKEILIQEKKKNIERKKILKMELKLIPTYNKL